MNFFWHEEVFKEMVTRVIEERKKEAVDLNV